MRVASLLTAAVVANAACSSATPEPAPLPAATPVATTPRPAPAPRVVRETVTVRDAELERRVARLELRVIEKETQADLLQTRLDDARDEVVRTMAKLQSVASRAEAASGIAEGEVALQSLRASAGNEQVPEVAQVAALMRQSSAEFNKQNFGGAFYLANQAKSLATAARARVGGAKGATRPGETPFEVPIRLRTTARGNVREGPGTNFPVSFAIESGATLTAFSHTDEWVRISDDDGRVGWIFRSLVGRP